MSRPNRATSDTFSHTADRPAVTANGRTYAWPKQPAVVVCFDGCDPAYIEAASAAGVIPTIDRMRREGFATLALAAMPTFTNPNNVSIVCGVSPAVHGVSGNFYLDRETGAEIMMVDATPMRAPTLLAGFSEAGAKVAAVTAKDKLRKALGHGLVRDGLEGIAFSAEKADEASEAENGVAEIEALVGRRAPDQYSADLSLFVLDAGIRLLETQRPELTYLSLSDYVQHKHAPHAPEALEFMREVDQRLAQILSLGARLGIVADHGMSDMSVADGAPNVIYLSDLLDAAFGPGTTRVICPITDPFVRHHGALGGFVRVHLQRPGLSHSEVIDVIRQTPGVAMASPREEACLRFDLPADREGDIAVVARKGVALGAHARDHDLSQLSGERLRSHGGLEEQVVPFILSHPLKDNVPVPLQLRNYDVFSVLLNDVAT
ncbi:phosphonoacetate hydrolase [Pseudorhodoplanes sinuspersici]|uniref:Phosphonoacetate hydrolase n=1 Tax=Pseudorhodoplanes sinuspersici TaxID=1235591 RepID=A0A1W6ZQN2_9HYPH|nr:phosphonoacetate hydrolase [Pseudorhodoplanes sinuspersici]ARP99652.1 phosphonoacetate hydrolase [Pseudorhodoplanes sinuspersici]RKE70630.1 phosphonoacetate hydrolase [Pseudorhodoplanes sinuspersici]